MLGSTDICIKFAGTTKVMQISVFYCTYSRKVLKGDEEGCMWGVGLGGGKGFFLLRALRLSSERRRRGRFFPDFPPFLPFSQFGFHLCQLVACASEGWVLPSSCPFWESFPRFPAPPPVMGSFRGELKVRWTHYSGTTLALANIWALLLFPHNSFALAFHLFLSLTTHRQGRRRRKRDNKKCTGTGYSILGQLKSISCCCEPVLPFAIYLVVRWYTQPKPF